MTAPSRGGAFGPRVRTSVWRWWSPSLLMVGSGVSLDDDFAVS